MEGLLVKIFATALTLSQVLTAPENLKTEFDPGQDRAQVMRLLRQGCVQLRQAFDVEEINIDDLITTAMSDPDALSAKFRGVSFAELHGSYRVLCQNEKGDLPVDIGEVIAFYNDSLRDLPDPARLRGLTLPGTAVVLGYDGKPFTEVYEAANHRITVPLDRIPEHVQRAFVSAEDRRFYEHKGVDERGMIRAFIANLASSRGLQGGSTITQQVAKNLLVGNETSYVRKMREMVVASRMERVLTKQEILGLYLNAVFLGRGAWGVEAAARAYFGKPVDRISLAEAALLAGEAKGPTYYNPSRFPKRARERVGYVLMRLQVDGAISEAQRDDALAQPSTVVAYKPVRPNSGRHFVDYLAREARQVVGLKLLTQGSYEIRSTINPKVQEAAEAALQEGLANYELRGGRARFQGAETNLAGAVRKIQESPNNADASPAWQRALKSARLPLYDVHWPAAIVLSKSDGRHKSESVRVGLADGRIVPLSIPARAKLELHDVVYVKVTESRGGDARAELRVRPQVQGAVVVLENKTGRILALAGSFSYALSQLNRATQAQRQPGSAIKPVTYLAALAKGLQPNTIINDSELTLPPPGGGKYARPENYWTPSNYGGSERGAVTLRSALEHSRNLATAQLMAYGLARTPEQGLQMVCNIALEAQIYRECIPYYPFILGAQPVRPIDLARFYATIANEGLSPLPYAVESVSENGIELYQHPNLPLPRLQLADAPAFFQLKTLLQGVVRSGTAARMSALAPYIGGKTGTTQEETDAWFVGFSNDVTIAVWVGYDNADGKRRTLGHGRTGGNVAIPIFEPVMQAAWQYHAPRAPLAPPSEQAAKLLVAVGTSRDGERERKRGRAAFVEYLRRDAKGRIAETRYAVMSKAHAEQGDKPKKKNEEGEDAYASAYGRQPWYNERPWARERSQSWFGDFNSGWGRRDTW